MFQRMFLTFLLAFSISAPVTAKSPGAHAEYAEATPISTSDLSPIEIPPVRFDKKKNLINRFIDYIGKSNQPDTTKSVDLSILGGPFYSTDTKLGLGLVGALLYKSDPDNPAARRSEAAVKGQISTSLYYSFAITGYHLFPGERYRIDYNLKFSSFPTWFWGIGYRNGRDNNHKTKYKDQRFTFGTRFQCRIADDLYIGPAFETNYVMSKDITSPEIWGDLPTTVTSIGTGLTFQYDTRDNFTAPTRGLNIIVDQRFYPVFLGNSSHSFSSTRLSASHYFKPWRSAVIASRINGLFTYGKTPWSMMATIGGPVTMRGYYEGRYRDKCSADITVELRQHLLGRSGIALWLGAGTVFSGFDKLNNCRLLPNAGAGYRWEFKQNTNVRVDVGFGRGEWGIEFNINEAF